MHLRTFPDPVLLRPSTAVEIFDAPLREKLAEMWSIMYTEKGVGLAAPQVGWSERVLVFNPSGEQSDESGARVVINPKVLKRWGKVKDQEGCLSFPEIYVDVVRAAGVRLQWQDEHGTLHEEDINDFPARIVQHEMDHLEGVLLVHRMSPVDRIRYRRELAELAESLETAPEERA